MSETHHDLPPDDDGSMLADSAIKAAIRDGEIQISPFNEEQLNPTSYDVTLGDGVAVYEHWVSFDREYDVLGPFRMSREMFSGPRNGSDFIPIDRAWDIRKEPKLARFKIDPERGWLLKPGIGYLMHTVERIQTSVYVPVLDGKSSIGRLFLKIHETAGFGDVGFDGQFTLEVTVVHPLIVYPGMRIGQVRFHTKKGEVEKPYNVVGHYRGEAAQGAVGSQAWKQFQK